MTEFSYQDNKVEEEYSPSQEVENSLRNIDKKCS